MLLCFVSLNIYCLYQLQLLLTAWFYTSYFCDYYFLSRYLVITYHLLLTLNDDVLLRNSCHPGHSVIYVILHFVITSSV